MHSKDGAPGGGGGGGGGHVVAVSNGQEVVVEFGHKIQEVVRLRAAPPRIQGLHTAGPLVAIVPMHHHLQTGAPKPCTSIS